ncbi:MAG: hypothetical protein JWM16_2901 [Verrucomicrobiales bacterium]|nr:hypothetical protein [Verrucomicrobiales bacterium]
MGRLLFELKLELPVLRTINGKENFQLVLLLPVERAGLIGFGGV